MHLWDKSRGIRNVSVGTSRTDVHTAETYVTVLMCMSASRQSEQPLFTKPGWPFQGRVMMNGHLPVIYLQDDGWSRSVWLTGWGDVENEDRRWETAGDGEWGVSCLGPETRVGFPWRWSTHSSVCETASVCVRAPHCLFTELWLLLCS